jgi:hypothetical protein
MAACPERRLRSAEQALETPGGRAGIRVTRLQTPESHFELARVCGASAAGVREITGYLEHSDCTAVRRELPRPWLSLVWEIGTPIEHLTPTASHRMPAGFVVGLHFRV